MSQRQVLEHKPAVVAVQKTADGAISVLVRCDGDPTTDSWHTVYVTAATTDADVAAWKQGILDGVATLHATSMRVSDILGAGL